MKNKKNDDEKNDDEKNDTETLSKRKLVDSDVRFFLRK